MNEAELEQIARRSRKAAFLTAGGTVLVLASLAFAGYSLRSEIQKLAAKKTELKKTIEELGAKKLELEKATPLALESLGHKDPSANDGRVLSESLTAYDLAQGLARSGADRRGRARVVVRYYPKNFERDLNEQVVLPRLIEYGFRPEVGETQVGNVPTNSIWWGAGVHPDDVRLVALTLAAAGVEIKQIRSFQDATGPKREVIQVGASRDRAGAPTLSPQQIMDAVEALRGNG